MNESKTGKKTKGILKYGCLIFFVLPFLCLSLYMLVFDYAIMFSWIGGDDVFTHESNDMLGKHGDEIAAFHLIAYLRKLDPTQSDENHVKNIVRLYKKNPAAREAYLAYIVSGILDSDIHYSRVQLIRTLELLTGEEFGYYMSGCSNREIPEEAKPQIEQGLENVRLWWIEHNEELKINKNLRNDEIGYN